MKKKDGKTCTWNVLHWNINKDELEIYDVMPTLVRCYKAAKVKPATRAQLDEFLEHEAMYCYWAKCEHEVIVHSWPKFKNDAKVDVYAQLKMNWDAFVDCFWKEISKSKRSKKRSK